MNSNIYERKEFLNNSWNDSPAYPIFTLSSENEFSVVTINLLRATANEADDFDQFLKNNIVESNQNIVFDFSNITFIDSTFLSVLVSFNKRNGKKINLVITDERQFLIFKITKLDKIFNIISNIKELVKN